MTFQGIRTSIAKKSYIFVIFQGGGRGSDPVPPMDPRMALSKKIYKLKVNIYVKWNFPKLSLFPFGMIHYSPSGNAVQYPQEMTDIFVVLEF